MRKIIVFSLIALCIATGNANAESIAGRLGLNGKVGTLVPLRDSDIKGITFETDYGFAGGGGLIYGFSDHLAGDLDITHAPSLDAKIADLKAGDVQLTDISLGLQYRFTPQRAIVPYVGAGIDAIYGNIEETNMDWTFGGHVNGGVDYFLNKSIAFNVDVRGIFADKIDIEQNGVKVGEYDPMSFVATVGIRLFLPEKL